MHYWNTTHPLALTQHIDGYWLMIRKVKTIIGNWVESKQKRNGHDSWTQGLWPPKKAKKIKCQFDTKKITKHKIQKNKKNKKKQKNTFNFEHFFYTHNASVTNKINYTCLYK